MSEPRFRAAPAEALRRVDLDAFVAVYHRPSGITHLITAPAPELLALLAEAPLTRAELAARLGERYEVADLSAAALDERLEELLAAGLAVPA